jgi:hypothetical protein
MVGELLRAMRANVGTPTSDARRYLEIAGIGEALPQ